ncbi:MAG: helix-turn-helix domain-containing protein [Steroidobacteraceae bacterium]
MADQPAKERTVVIEDESLRQFAGGFTSIPNRILRNGEISLGSRMCYAMLLSYAWQDNFCFPAQLRLADDLGIGERTVRQYLNELRDAELITWKQRGLNRPNIYRILKIPALVPPNGNGRPGPADSAEPDRQDSSGQDRHSASAYKDTTKNTHKVVNDVTDNDHESPSKSPMPARRKTPTISNTALRSKYELTDDQIGRVHWLVQKQAETLGAVERNHAHYVKRAAEAVRDGADNLLDAKLGDFKQASTDIAVGTRPGYFHSMWLEALQQRSALDTAPSLPTPKSRTSGPQAVGDLFRHSQNASAEDPRARMIADAERRGVRVPDYIRAADVAAVGRWWAAILEAAPSKRS